MIVLLVETNLTHYLVTSDFCVPPAVGDGYGLGTIGRGAVRGPGQHNVDFSMMKQTIFDGLRENAALEFRAEFFNLFNTPNLPTPPPYCR